MKAVLILASAALAAAQGYFVGEPDCAIPCLTDAISKVGCAAGDISCQCSPATQSSLAPIVAPCLTSKCSSKELGQALQAGNDICSSFAAGKLTFSASPMPSTAAVTGSMSLMTTPSGTAATTPLTQPLLSIQTSIPSNATASMSMPTSMSITQSASVPTPTGSGGSGASSTAAASSTSPPANAAATQGVAKVVGGVLAGLVGVVVAL
ncbi:CFEM domain-containing protein [Apiospora marii]|uniref:CFEM domain-containing protein n=1 Tax=Apiospora marii TaxID=335849 RepID=A0ABR1RE64_9PEZI